MLEALALLLAMRIGSYGLISYEVARRTQEIGILSRWSRTERCIATDPRRQRRGCLLSARQSDCFLPCEMSGATRNIRCSA